MGWGPASRMWTVPVPSKLEDTGVASGQMRTVASLSMAIVLAAGCFSSDAGDPADDPPGPGDPIDSDGDGVPDGVVLDDAPAPPEGDIDGDGLSNDVDTDDDGDAVPDDVDVDADGDGALEEEPSADAVQVAWEVATVDCERALECCITSLDDYGYDNSDDFRVACAPASFVDTLPSFAQAAATAGAALDQAAWDAENRGLSPVDSFTARGCENEEVINKGGANRLPGLDELVLPYFHGTRAIGEECATLWDCEASARCEGLGSGEMGTCALRPRWDGPCGGSEPYCYLGQICVVTDGEPVCADPRGENDFCWVFEHGGLVTDNCDGRNWCDEMLDTPACRPLLYPGDPCEEDRQCAAFECGEDGCPERPDSEAAWRASLEDWCSGMLEPG